ncbi:MAG: triose-phosphate isomerase [Planctomycetes bacterium]|jgi:triosephosphate isomerase|nr:triose-phosphate isomerase [Planctomycetota bacterium]
MRKKFIAGNWKMNTSGIDGELLAAGVVNGVADETRVTVAVCPPFPFLARIAQVVKGTPVALGAQNCYPKANGAFTGEISPGMLIDVGCQYVIVGHSERRQIFKESDAFINQKIHAALGAGLRVILCIGETLDERQSNRTEAVLDAQLTGSLANVTAELLRNVVLAYEPVWAIGTGVNATPQQAQDAHAFVRKRVGQLCGAAAAQAIVIQYGGSVKPDNAATLLGQPDVDGALVGGASLKADDFLEIVRAGIQ